jgi:hypothetical protein
MNPVTDLILRTLSTLIATLATVAIITERQRRINNARIELAARYLESIKNGKPNDDPGKEIVRDLKLAEEMIREIAWSRIARVAKIDEVMHISRKLAHARREHERLEERASAAELDAAIAKEVENQRFLKLAADVRELKTSFIDFVFVGIGGANRPPDCH